MKKAVKIRKVKAKNKVQKCKMKNHPTKTLKCKTKVKLWMKNLNF